MQLAKILFKKRNQFFIFFEIMLILLQCSFIATMMHLEIANSFLSLLISLLNHLRFKPVDLSLFFELLIHLLKINMREWKSAFV